MARELKPRLARNAQHTGTLATRWRWFVYAVCISIRFVLFTLNLGQTSRHVSISERAERQKQTRPFYLDPQK